jgi:hypothetical protein
LERSSGGNQADTSGEARANRGAPFWFLVVGVALAAVVILWVLLGLALGDNLDVDGMRIVNRTDSRLVIYEVVPPDATEVVQIEIPPRTEVVTTLNCARNQLLAKAGGTTIAQRGPFDECDTADWVIAA